METKKCKGCKKMRSLTLFVKTKKESYTLYCNECLEKQRQYRRDNNEDYNLRARQRYVKNKEKILEYHQNTKAQRNERLREKGKNDPVYRAKESLKARIHDLLKNVKAHKSNHLMGCSKKELQDWLESQFGDEYSWDNYGKDWHIDHVVPISFFNITDPNEQLICFNWTNLRPLHATSNVSKSCKVLEDDILQHIQTLKQFPRYQANYENSWWRRVELRYGNNPQDDGDFVNHLKWAIRNQITN